MRLSYWERKNLNKKRGVVIIGAGLVGLSAAIEVKNMRPDLSVLVIDRAPIGAAASTRNAGFACFGSISEICTDIDIYGEDKVIKLVKRRKAGIRDISFRFRNFGIGYKESGGYEIFRSKDEFERWESDVKYINDLLDDKIFSIINTPPPLSTFHKCIFNNSEGQLDTGQLYSAMLEETRLKNIEIIRGIEVVQIDKASCLIEVMVNEEKLDIHFDKLILASNALTKSFYPALDVQGVRNQVLITKPIKNHGLSGCFHLDKGYVYFRDVEDRVLIGGARNLFSDEETTIFGQNSDNLDYLFNLLKTQILTDTQTSEIEIASTWSGILCGGSERIPIIEKISENLTVAVRLSGMGVAIGIDVGREAATLSLQ